MKFEKWLHRNVFLIAMCVLLIVLFVHLSFSSYNIYKVSRENYRADNIDAIKQRMNSLFLEINNFPQDEGNDILYLGRMTNLNKFINAKGPDRDSLKKDVESDFYIFMDGSPVYYQLRYIDENGMEILRLDRIGDDISIASEDELQSKKIRYYFEAAMKLDKGEVYVSPLDLNVEGGVIENRGTVENPEYVPVIRYAMPIFGDGGSRRGVVVFNVYADYFLEDIRRLNHEGEISFLIDNRGYYLAHPNKLKEFSFMFGGEHSINSDYGNIGNDIINGFGKRVFEDEDNIFTIRHLYPIIGTFEIYQGSKKILGENPAEEYYWVLVSVSEKGEFDMNIDNIRNRFIVFVLISAVLISAIMVLLLIVLAMNGGLRNTRK